MSAEDNLIRDKRALFRSVATDKKEICGMLKENPSLDNVYKAAVYLDCWKEELSKIALINSKLIELIDTDKCPTQDDVYKQEDKITKEYETSLSELKKCTGEIQAMKARLEKQEQLNRSLTNESLNNSLVGGFSSNNSSIKLPDIDVPKFDGNIENFTEWNNMFDAVVNQNPNLLPPQKMYYLKLAMVDGAKYILKDYGIDGSLYEDAYGHLKDRYLNKRKIMESHFRFIFDLPNITWSNVRETLDKYEATVRGIRAVGLDTKKLSPMLAYGLARRLPDRLKQDWENSNSDFSIYPGFESLSKWLNNRCLSIETVNSDKSKERSKSPNQAKKPNKPAATEKTKSSLALVNKPNQTREIPDCVDCGQKHYLAQCSSFLKKSVSDRESFVASKRLCRNCLRKGHFVKQCYASKCKECGENHHTLLHSDSTKNQTPPVSPDNEKSNKESQTKTSMAASQSDIDVLLPTAVVNVRVGKRIVPARVLIDSASQVNLVTESFVNRNHIAKTPSTSNIAGIAPSSVRLNHFVSLTIESRVNKTRIRLDADVIGSLPYNIEPRIIQQIASVLPNLELADNGLQSTSIDILIGAEYASRLTTGQKKFIGDLCLEESQFGWLTVGPFKELKPIDPKCCCLSVTVHDVLQKFWEVEEVIPPKITLHEHELCQNHFEQTYERLSDGRFQVRLPFKSSLENLSDTYRQAYGALLKYEKAGEPLRSQYIEFMQEYLDLGHMQLADTTKDVQRYYIPHLPVIREDSTTTKFRAVFNASAHTKGKLSLNQVLMNGLIKQPPLFNLLTGFRMYEVAYSADIEKFYRQVYVHPDDRPYQSIIWRFDITKPVEIYELNTVTYGTTPAGYETTECLEVIGKKVPPELPEVAKAIRKEIWMDNLLSGEENVEKAITKAKIIHNELLKAKFPLRKYISNSKEFLEAFEPKLRETLQPVSFSSSGAAKILGLQWYPTEDEFRINFKPVNLSNVKLTKRVVSSLIARVYDPLGFANPILIKGKILLQDLWRQGLEWDDPIPEEIKNRFLEYYADLANLFNLHIPRRYASFVIKKFELIGFSDASNKAYGAVVYLKAYNIESKETEVTLVCSKSKVAPLKDIKVPRLELLGTVLLSKLMKVVAEVLQYDISSTFAFCDSTIVLAWLKGPASKYDVFVRNRVDYVTSLIPFNRWNYVNTKENPADLVTRGLTVESLVNNQLWIHGPSWLKNEINCSIKVDLPENPPEVRKSYYSMVACVTANEEIISRFSSLDKLIRVFTLVKTFIVRTRSKDKTATVTYQDAVNDLYKISQLHWFQAEINALKQGDPVHSRSKLASIDPFIDKNGVLRVGGRLRNSTLSYDFKHPIILHSQSNLAKLLVRHVHEKYYHTSQAFTRSFILRRHWIVNGIRSLARKTIENCVWCTRMNAKPVEQIMGDLPTERTTVSRPFTNSSVDYAGPFTIRCTNHRSPKHLKYYAAFFVCLTTRAVHIEAVADQSTPSFIAAFQRFIARRGFPAVMWSDNGNNFVGAKNEFQLNQAANPIVWKFIPPRSPHQGGIWESAVKSGKKHLLAVTKGAVFTEDEFKTVLTTIESIMNSRPLYQRAATKDLDEIDVLTPGHFLVGSHLLEPCVPEVSPISLSNRLNFQRQIISSFWTKWRQSYLAQLQTRSKWKTQSPNLSIGDIVIVKELCSPCSWPLARIIDGKPDAKGRLRIVTIKTKNNKAVYQRSVQQLVKLPVDTLEDTVPSSSDTA